MKKIIIFSIVFFIASCATEVSTLKVDKDVNLESSSGYLLFGLETSRDLEYVVLSGPMKIIFTREDIRFGTNYILADVEAGIYEIKKIQLNRRWYLNPTGDDWKVEVKKGEASYVGHLELASHRYIQAGEQYKLELVNRSSEAIEFMELKFPEILAVRPLTYGGPGEDDFFETARKVGVQGR